MNNFELDHLGLNVKDIEATKKSFSALGIECQEVIDCPEVGLKIACLKLGDVVLELLEVVDPKSPVANDPLGFHHAAIKTDDIEKQYHLMKESDQCQVEGEIRRGLHNRRLFFFRLKDSPQMLYECVEESR